jgi:hypothetical protein
MDITERLVAMPETLRKMGDALHEFDKQFSTLQRLRGYAERDFTMMHYDHNAVQEKGNELNRGMMQARHEVMRHVDDVTAFLHANGMAYVWKMYPAPAFGGIVKSANIFEAFIDLQLDSDERPKLIQVSDLLSKGLIVCERRLQQMAENPPSVFADGLKRSGRGLAEVMAWLFPSQIQRTIFGWCIVTFAVGLVLRYVFGFHLEQIGQLVIKWAFK